MSKIYRNTYWTKNQEIRSDNGGEYISTDFKTFLSKAGIRYQNTCGYTPQQNGVAKRMNRTLKYLMRTITKHKNVSEEFWRDFIATAAYVRTLFTIQLLSKHKNPFHLWYGTAPIVSDMRLFGSKFWYKHNTLKKKSLGSVTRKAIMIGYATKTAYMLWNQINSKNCFIVRRHI